MRVTSIKRIPLVALTHERHPPEGIVAIHAELAYREMVATHGPPQEDLTLRLEWRDDRISGLEPKIQNLIDRLDHSYDFSDQAGMLTNCAEWQDLKSYIHAIVKVIA